MADFATIRLHLCMEAVPMATANQKKRMLPAKDQPSGQASFMDRCGLMATDGGHTCGCQRGPNMEQGKWYGVRSYLHLFYEDCTGTHSEDNLENAATSPTKDDRTPVFWKVTLSAGTLLLLTGAAALTTGSLLPSKLEDIGEAEFVVLDQRAVEYNDALGICRAVGVVLCAVAGVLLVASVVLSRVGRRNRTGYPGDNGKEEQLSPILQENAPHPWGAIVSATPAPFQVSWVQGVQPKGEM
ncbi:neurensin-2 [Protobothrops mucrosquamatus]|uniref:neurensin-2 n=1 Tax=Protobothrops mucrosquamatus TaxID=103944 RepID=UPI0007757EC5|nr:neurensin-2 [Protobothrops mucrosquamatus]